MENKSVAFTQAHQLTKQIIKAGDNYRTTFSACLKYVWEQLKKGIKNVMETVKKATTKRVSKRTQVSNILKANDMELGCWDTRINSLTPENFKKVLEAVEFGDNTKFLVKKSNKWLVVMVDVVDNELDLTTYTKEEYIDMRGEYAWEDLLEWEGVSE